MTKTHTARRKRARPHTPTAAPVRLVLLPNLLDAMGEPRPAIGRAFIVFRDIPAALAARRDMEVVP